MDNIITALMFFLFGVLFGIWFSARYITINYRDPMDALGIERFQKCEITTTNCHSNWYEIVWKKDRK